ncbi:MAG: ubiquinol-cytochrome C chaperone family protein, partial [Alphaproteobacteria bacterium]
DGMVYPFTVCGARNAETKNEWRKPECGRESLMAWSLKRLFRPSDRTLAAQQLYNAAVTQARSVSFFSQLMVPDTVIGRFDMISLHVFFIAHRFVKEPTAQALSESFCAAFFTDLDRNMREMGVGDLSVGKKVKKLAEGFYGRAGAYEGALNGKGDSMDVVLTRNIFSGENPGEPVLAALSDYVVGNVEALASQPLATLMAGDAQFLPAPELTSVEGERTP